MSKTKRNHISFFDSLLDKETLSEEDFIKLNKIWEQFLQWRKNKETEERLKHFVEHFKPRENEAYELKIRQKNNEDLDDYNFINTY